MPERLQKILAAAGLGSRRKCEQWIKEGCVSVDGHIVTELGTTADASRQRIEFNNRPIPKLPTRKTYIALNKPRGYACTLADPHAAHVVTELIDLPGKPLLRPVGRLDIETEGLIFLTDDGQFLYRITHPKFQIEKQYLATVRGTPTEEELDRLRTGVYLDDGSKAVADKVRLAGVFPKTETSDVELIIHEGRNRMIRRMCSAIGHPVLRLVRQRIGFVTHGAMPAGGWRHLTATEVQRLMKQDAGEGVSSEEKAGTPISRVGRPRTGGPTKRSMPRAMGRPAK